MLVNIYKIISIEYNIYLYIIDLKDLLLTEQKKIKINIMKVFLC